MKKLLLILLLISTPAFAQQSVLNDISAKEADISQRNLQITTDNQWIANANADIIIQQNAIAADNTAITNDTNANATYKANNAQTISDVNWDYYIALEASTPPIRYASWTALTPNVNWSSIEPLLGVTCSVTESSVNWTNWKTCKANGMNPSAPTGTYATGVASFWCGSGSIPGTC